MTRMVDVPFRLAFILKSIAPKVSTYLDFHCHQTCFVSLSAKNRIQYTPDTRLCFRIQTNPPPSAPDWTWCYLPRACPLAPFNSNNRDINARARPHLTNAIFFLCETVLAVSAKEVSLVLSLSVSPLQGLGGLKAWCRRMKLHEGVLIVSSLV